MSTEKERTIFRLHYTCPRCNGDWYDEWTAQIDDDCPFCMKCHISPESSKVIKEHDRWFDNDLPDE